MTRAVSIGVFAAAVVAVVLFTGHGSAQKAPPAADAVGFDHRGHADSLVEAKVGALTCTGCHDANDPTAVRGHRTCFGKCHGASPRKLRKRGRYRIDWKRKKVCTACHSEAALVALRDNNKKPPKVTLPLPKRAKDRKLSVGVYPVGVGFSHARHKSRSKAPCASCHKRIMRSLNNRPQRPKKPECASCHNGAKAFAMTEARCRQCHFQAGTRIQRHATKLVRFSHKAHMGRGKLAACATCHQLTGNGTPLAAARNHAPCSNSGCHRDDFKSLRPKVCGACHVAREPWRPLHRDRGWPDETEFGARFSHKAHLSGSKPRMKATCGRCHQVRSGKRELRPPHDHSSCTGQGCHARTAKVRGGAKPPLSECGKCHKLELVRKHQLVRHTARWSVRSKFSHAKHRLAKGSTKPLACAQCHRSTARAVSLRDVKAPAKAACMPCHNGAAAFKLTGHNCARCHGSDR